MIKSILAVSEGGPDAAMAFGLAARLAGLWGALVDALHVPAGPSSSALSGFAMTAEAMPLQMTLDDENLAKRAQASERAYAASVGAIKGSTFTDAPNPGIGTLIGMGRCSDLLVLGRPGADPDNVSPASVDAAIHECARPVMIAPPMTRTGSFPNVVVAWNGSVQAARAVNYAMPLLAAAQAVTILLVGAKREEVGAALLARNLGRQGIVTTIDTIDPGAVSGRARGRALLRYTHDRGADLLVMGAYGRGQVLSFLGLGGATGKVIASCRVPVLMAH